MLEYICGGRVPPSRSDVVEEIAADEELIEVFGEVMALIGALEQLGRSLEGEETSPIVSSQYDMHELRVLRMLGRAV